MLPDFCVTPTPDRCQALAASVRGQRLHFPPSVPNDSCGDASNYVQPVDQLPADASEELHIVGVYEGEGAQHGPSSDVHLTGVVEVVVHHRPKPVVLALTSYEPVRWVITLRPGANVSRVLTQGYYDQEIAYVRDRTGLIETSYQGCYRGDRFEIPHWEGEPPTTKPTPQVLDESIARLDMTFPGCEDVMGESHYCMTTISGGAALIGLDSGDVCPIVSSENLVALPFITSLSWRGQALYMCAYPNGLMRLSLLDGNVESAEVPCGAVTDFGNALALTGGPFGYGFWDFGLNVYPSYEAVLSGPASAKYDIGPDSRLTIHGDRVYSAWHSTNVINVFDLAANAALTPITLEGYDGWILGMAVNEAGELMISGDIWGDTIYVFDLATGSKLRELHPTMPVYGLACVARAE